VFAPIAILNNGGYNSEWANITGNPNSGGGTPSQWFNTAAYANPAPYTYGNSKPNSLLTDWGKSVNLSVFRNFRIGLGEERYFQFRAEAYNLFNDVVFGYPNSTLGQPNFGVVNTTTNLPRQLQLGLKFYF